MRNIENITLENWQEIEVNKPVIRPTYHFAIRQNDMSLDFHFRPFFREEEVSFHHFQELDELKSICLRYPIDAIIIGGKSLFLKELELVRSIKRNIVMAIVPVILYHPEPERDVIVAAYENGAEDFIIGEWIARLIEVRIKSVIDRSRRDLAVNPSTRLPGPTMIEQEIDRQMVISEQFAVCYADLDNFKPYNDYYGYAYGDSIIKMTGRIIKDVVYDLCSEAFVGHIAGDDFIYIIPVELVDSSCQWIIKCFDAFIPYRYELEDRERGFIRTKSRRGELEDYPILSISIAVIVNRQGMFKHIGELSHMLADLKKACKLKDGSNYMLERRKKY